MAFKIRLSLYPFSLSYLADKAKEYEELKESLAKRFPNERKNYTAGKAEFVDSILSLRVR